MFNPQTILILNNIQQQQLHQKGQLENLLLFKISVLNQLMNFLTKNLLCFPQQHAQKTNGILSKIFIATQIQMRNYKDFLITKKKILRKKKLYYQYQMISKLLTQVFSLGRHLFLTIIVSVQYPKYILNGLIRNNIDYLFFSELNQLALKGVYEMTFTNMNYKEFEKFVNENNHDYQYIFYNNRERSKENRLMIVKAQLINLEQEGKKKQKIKL